MFYIPFHPCNLFRYLNMESRFAYLRERDTSVSMLRVKMSRRRSQSQKENRERVVNTRRKLDKLSELEMSSLNVSIATTAMSPIQEKQNNAKSAKSTGMTRFYFSDNSNNCTNIQWSIYSSSIHLKYFALFPLIWGFIKCLFPNSFGPRQIKTTRALERTEITPEGEGKERKGAQRDI